MIGETLAFLRRYLDEQIRAALGGSADDGGDAVITFLDLEKADSLSFKLGAVSMLLTHVEEERLMRAPDPYLRTGPTGNPERVQPEIRLVLCILFVSRYRDYDLAWDQLSRVLSQLQTERVFERQSHPELPEGVQKLIFELSTPSYAEQSQIWGALRSPALPSLHYRVRLLAFQDRRPSTPPTLSSPQIDVKRIS